jgi:molybdate transport system substrate-binding protein
MRVRSISLVLLTFATLSANRTLVYGQATNGQLKVLASNGFRAVFEELTPRCEKAIGHPLSTQFGTSTGLVQRAKDGEAFDVAVMTTDAIDDLGKTGTVTAASRVMLGRSGIGVGVRMGAVKPDIKTVDALKQTLLRAKAVSYAGDGASRPHIESMFDALGITKAMAAKSVLEQGSVRAAAKVASGDAELLLTLISEILPAPGLELVGPLPELFQHYVAFAAATGKSAAHADAAAALIKCLSAPDAGAILKAKGMER